MDRTIRCEDHERRAAQRRVEERRKRILDPLRRPSSRRGRGDAHTASQPRDAPTPSNPVHPTRRRNRANSFSTNMAKLSLLNTAPVFDYPQPTHPQSAQEQSLAQELALCDFRSYLLVMEAQNHERLRQARQNEWAALSQSPVEQEDEGELAVRDQQMEVQAGELARLRRELQGQLEGLTGREYPLPETYLLKEELGKRAELDSSSIRSSLRRWNTDGN